MGIHTTAIVADSSAGHGALLKIHKAHDLPSLERLVDVVDCDKNKQDIRRVFRERVGPLEDVQSLEHACLKIHFVVCDYEILPGFVTDHMLDGACRGGSSWSSRRCGARGHCTRREGGEGCRARPRRWQPASTCVHIRRIPVACVDEIRARRHSRGQGNFGIEAEGRNTCSGVETYRNGSIIPAAKRQDETGTSSKQSADSFAALRRLESHVMRTKGPTFHRKTWKGG
jgi:hypothetical protein